MNLFGKIAFIASSLFSSVAWLAGTYHTDYGGYISNGEDFRNTLVSYNDFYDESNIF